ncbi:hypothetical protein PM082_016356 [Marasmius tenuissimus]|nr:hypothetical protein PM082_016356 [Marasmius tenuissimus]
MDILFRHLTIPALKSLSVSSDPAARLDISATGQSWQSSGIGNILARSGCRITSLCLESLPITDTEVLTLLGSMPTLTSLQVEEFALPAHGTNKIVTEVFLRRLVIYQEAYWIGRPGVNFLPLLTDIVFKVRAHGLAEEDLFAVVASRWVPEADRAKELEIQCLRSIDITVMDCNDQVDSSLESLTWFRDAGLRVNINHRYISRIIDLTSL